MSELYRGATERPARERLVRKAAILAAITGMYVLGVGSASALDRGIGHDHTGGWSPSRPASAFSSIGRRSGMNLSKESNITASDPANYAAIHEGVARPILLQSTANR
jgi:zinc transporter ZupT